MQMNKQRIGRIIANMRRHGLHQLVVSSTASLYYITGIWAEPFERMLALWLDDEGNARLFANEIFGLAELPGCPLVCHKDGADPVADLAKVVKPGRLGIDKFWYSKFLIGLMQLRPDIVPVHGSPPIDEARMLKDAAELEQLRASSRINDEVVGLAIRAVREGAVEQELAAQINRDFRQRGADAEGVQLVCFGANGADPHHEAADAVIKPGDSVTFDIIAPIDRYWCDMTRTVFYKEVSARQREVYELVRRANETARELVRPGVLLSDLDKAARDVIAAGGYGEFFTHRLGHGIGLECHEPPDVSAASPVLLQPGMVFSIEPGIYLPGEFGVRIEDLVAVTEDGCELLNQYPRDLLVVG